MQLVGHRPPTVRDHRAPTAPGHGTSSPPAAEVAAPVVASMVGELPVRVEFWDGSAIGPEDGPGTIRLRTPDALRRILWAPGELGVARAFVAGDLDVEGEILPLIKSLRPAGARLHNELKTIPAVVKALHRFGLMNGPLSPPPEEAHVGGWLHTRSRDAEAISHHYDVGNDFYRLFLGETMTYSCARFADDDMTLDEAQEAKHELVCRKLGLHERPGLRLLDVGCGWGSMAIHAAREHHAQVVAVTISKEQAELARSRVVEAGLSDAVDVRLQDYREVQGRFDAISSIGMFEHVGSARMRTYFTHLHEMLEPGGRLLNHAISSMGGSKLSSRSFTGRYVFPDGELIDVGEVALNMEKVGLEVRDVEALREHYELTLQHWVANLQEHWDEAVDLVGEGRARVWILYMAASSIGFGDGGLGLHQVLAVRPDVEGRSHLPRTRRSWN
ncbi:MAG: cyclopropane-fatty-acyl-phospholipid synthase family protein [Aquihabitans sp.]